MASLTFGLLAGLPFFLGAAIVLAPIMLLISRLRPGTGDRVATPVMAVLYRWSPHVDAVRHPYRENPHRGYGTGMTRIFDQVLSGVDREEASHSQFGGSGSFGNGSAMRVAPVALWTYPDIEATARLAAETSRVTHTHPIGVDGAVVQAVAAQYALTLEPGTQPDVDALLTDLHRLVHTPEFQARLTALPDLVDDPDDEGAVGVLGNGIAADRSVVTALYC